MLYLKKKEKDKFGYPITKYNDQKEPIIKEIKIYKLPYLKQESSKSYDVVKR